MSEKKSRLNLSFLFSKSDKTSPIFKSEELPEPLRKALSVMHFKIPTPIQEQAIPAAIEGRDIIGRAPTGTGKTAAFCIPILTHVVKNPEACALVLVPTRELATQIEDVWRQLTQFMRHERCATLIGGLSMNPQIAALKAGPRLVIATPGRLIDHLNRRTCYLDDVSMLVLDEADRMLDMGFEPQLKEILKHLPVKRQTMLFSATIPKEVENLVRRYTSDAVSVSIGDAEATLIDIEEQARETTVVGKNETLFDEVQGRDGAILVFARTRHRTDRLSRFLNDRGITVDRIHGGRSQAQRQSALLALRKGKVRVLVATDVAARGLDIRDIAHVINYDLPETREDYTHRIGRTARAGDKGVALSLVTPEDQKHWKWLRPRQK